MRVYSFIQSCIAAAMFVLISIFAILFVSGIRPYVVVSGSMEPEITTGSLCFVCHRDKEIVKGDIIVYTMEEMKVMHRVIDETPEGYVTKGDGNDTTDQGIVSPNRIAGFYVFHIPKMGYVAEAFKSPKTVIIVVFLLMMYFLITRMINVNCK